VAAKWLVKIKPNNVDLVVLIYLSFHRFSI